MRGYAGSSLGPTILNPDGTQETIGGNRRVVGNLELLFSLPGFDRSLRLGTFFDAGQVFASHEKMRMADIRYSAGVSLFWSSPLGPLKFSLAQPLNKKNGDKIERFQFTMGSSF